MNLHQPLEANLFYHIYNRGINGENLFKEERNYPYFLAKYAQYLSPVVETYAYCLLKNHFHLLVEVKDESILNTFYQSKKNHHAGLHSADFIVSKQFARLFSSYTQSINKAIERTGSLFESPFKRILVESDDYFTDLIRYIHQNPQKHGFVKDFREYHHSSYQRHLMKNPTKLQRKQVIEWFGTASEYINAHQQELKESSIDHLIVE